MTDYRDRHAVEERARRDYEEKRDELLYLYLSDQIPDSELCRRLKEELKPLRDNIEEQERISLVHVIAPFIEIGGEQEG